MNNITDNAAMITKFQAQSNTFRANAVFFTLVYPLVLPFVSMVSKGKVRLVRAVTCWQFLSLYPLLATPNPEKLAAALSLTRKVN